MATFNFRNKRSGKITEVSGSIADAEQYEKDHLNMEWLCAAPGIVDAFRVGRGKPTDAFRDRLKDIKKSHYKSTINTF